MALNTGFFFTIFYLFLSLVSIIHATPDLGIQRDKMAHFSSQETEEGLISYTSLIKFSNEAIPGDASTMTDAQFLNLVRVAYNQMIDLWRLSGLSTNHCPGTMIGMESGGSI